MILYPWVSHPLAPQNKYLAYVLNMYVHHGYRRQGIARKLMAAVTDWSREQGLSVVSLHASDQGRPLYESLGFQGTNEMRLVVRGTCGE
jgi:GNAT superfamily N-acetyltransferase